MKGLFTKQGVFVERVVLDTNVTIAKEIPPFMRNLKSHAGFVGTITKVSVIVADPTDNIFLECAIDRRADYIISGDSHLLNLGEYTKIQILKPKEFLIKDGWITENQAP